MKKLYDFYCKNCEKAYEAWATTTSSTVCPNCGSNHTERMVSAASFKVNGQGAYTNKMKV